MPDRPKDVARARLAAMALAAALFAAGEACAQQAADAVVYQRAWFDRFAPRTAYDLVQQVPGFVLEEMVEAPGLAASGGNVLVDGKRPTAKSGGLAEVLSRIPAGGGARVEVSRGAAGGSETQGQASVPGRAGEHFGQSGAELDGVRRHPADLQGQLRPPL